MKVDRLLIPKDVGRAIVEAGNVIACPLLDTDHFVSFCRARDLSVDRERLLRLEKLRLFSPVFRVRAPGNHIPPFKIPVGGGDNWFETGWAWDTTRVDPLHEIPDQADKDQEGYFSIFQIDYLQTVLLSMTLHVQIDSYLDDSSSEEQIRSNEWASHWIELAREEANVLRNPQYRGSRDLLCQFISDRYYPETQGDMRTIHISHSHYSDRWINIRSRDWDWYEVVRRWDPHDVESLFELTPEKLEHAYRGLAVEQASCDPLQRWHQLVQFVSVRERDE
jgi:hypothetical protein